MSVWSDTIIRDSGIDVEHHTMLLVACPNLTFVNQILGNLPTRNRFFGPSTREPALEWT